MQDLRLVGVHDDGEHVVLVGADGARYRLRVDEALRAAVRRDRARLGQLQIQLESQLRPRDIQARIRAGESAEEIAESGGLPLDRVRRYEGPVLAERAHVVGLARRTAYGRSGGNGTLEELVVSRLSARAVDLEGTRWDAWRQEDGDWTVQVEFVAGGRGRVARWSFDPGSRALTATDDEARWLSEEEPAEAGPLPARRLVSVAGEAVRGRERVYDVEADGGVRTGGHGQRPAPGDLAAGLLDALDAQRGVRGEPAPAPGAEPAPRVDALLADPPPAHPPASAPHEHEDRTVLPPPRPASPERAAGEHRPDEHVAAEDAEAAASPAEHGPAEHAPAEEAPAEHAPAPGPLPGDAAADWELGAEQEVAQDPEQEVAQDTPGGARTPDVPETPGSPHVDGAPEAGATGRPDADEAGEAGEQEQQDGKASAERPAPRRRNRSARRAQGGTSGKRSSVPSWDEIMFGAKKD
ncbi:septation protein SepH [Kineococcus sp. TRM81007]|uniref:septation protein SepH n=1 Tax=Kineococcus sp. TRM81007 TaxID=2925831 RepID=UPI001F56ECC3|nr:septation protein SepH [Kineococcus sp. TRM81007]MCI2240394.1 septation protein SepH [Kineococcus sp. TRM81007]